MFKYFHTTILSCAVFLKPLSAEEIKDGLYQEFFGNKSPKFEITYKYGKKNGKEKFWYENGQIKMESDFEDGKEHGFWKQWYENGQIKLKVEYKDGKENGLWEQWFDDGQQKSKSSWVNGTKDGHEWIWNKEGQLISKDLYQNGKIASRFASVASGFASCFCIASCFAAIDAIFFCNGCLVDGVYTESKLAAISATLFAPSFIFIEFNLL